MANLISGQTDIEQQPNRTSNPCKLNSIYFEFLGQTIFGSLSYDRLLRENKKIKNSLSVGLGAYFKSLSLPLSYNILFGKKKHYFETGMGLTMYYYHNSYFDKVSGAVDNKEYSLWLTPKIGYRFQNNNGGFFYRLNFFPFITLFKHVSGSNPYTLYYPDADQPWPWLGMSFGYTFKK